MIWTIYIVKKHVGNVEDGYYTDTENVIAFATKKRAQKYIDKKGKSLWHYTGWDEHDPFKPYISEIEFRWKLGFDGEVS